jgi:exonuclease III
LSGVKHQKEKSMIIELKGNVDENGKLTLHTHENLRSGDVDIVIAYIDEAEAKDEAEWDAQFAATPTAVFDALIEEGLADYYNGQTDAFDPTIEDD